MPIKFLHSVSVDDSVLYIDGENNRVGIGTDSPDVKLHVTGEIRAYDSSNTYRAVMKANSNWGYFNTNAPRIYLNTEIRVDSGLIGSYNEALQLRTSGTTRMYIDNSNGNVGIGTASPLYKLHSSNSGSRNDFQFTLDSFGTGATDGAQLGIQSGGAYIWNFENNDLYFATNNSRALTIKPSGDVGIGTTSPSQKLDVNGYARATSGFVGNSGLSLFGDNSSTNRVFITSGGDVGIGTTSPAYKLDVAGNARFTSEINMEEDHYINLRFEVPDNNNNEQYILLCRYAGGNDVNGTLTMDRTSGLRHACSVDIIVSAGSSATPVGGLRAIGVSGAGNPEYNLVTCYLSGVQYVALKIENPDSYYESTGAYFTGRIKSTGLKLAPKLSSELTSIVDFEANTLHTFSGDAFFRDGSVGIGTKSPGKALDVDGNGLRVQDNGDIVLDVNTQTGVFSIGDTAEIGGGAYIAGDSTDINIIADGGPIVIFKGGGNVGIGTTSPGQKLEVAGNGLFGNGNTPITLQVGEATGYTSQTNSTLKLAQGGGNFHEFRGSRSSDEEGSIYRMQEYTDGSLVRMTQTYDGETTHILYGDNISLSSNVITTGDLTVIGGDITLGGTGRIQGIDTVSSGTDAANKNYVDNALASKLSTTSKAADSNLLDGIDSSSFLRSDAQDAYTPKRIDFSSSTNWDAVGFGNLTNLHMQGHNQFWIGAGNGTWFTGTANSKSSASGLAADGGKAHDLLITTMPGTSTFDRGITFAVDTNGAGTGGYRLGKWHSSDEQHSSKLTVDGGLHVRGGDMLNYDYYADDYSTYWDNQGGGSYWTGDTGWIDPSITAGNAIQIQAGNTTTNSNNPSLQFHQYGYGGVQFRYDGPGDRMYLESTGSNRMDWFRNKTDHGYIDFGPANTSHAHIYTDRPNFYLNKSLTVSGGSIINSGDIRSNIFYDINDTATYVDPSSTSNILNLTVNGTTNIGANRAYKHITVDGDANTYYPVVIGGSGVYGFQTYSVSRRYNDPAPNTWNTSTHRGGLTFTFKWSGDTAWGGNHKPLRVIEFGENYSNMLGGFTLARTGGVVVWLRGGSARYTIHTPAGNEAAVTIYLSGFTDGSGTNYPVRTTRVTSEWEDRWPIHGDNSVSSVDTAYATVFYDRDDTNYYVNPGSTSRINSIDASSLSVRGNTQLGNGNGDTTHINDIVHIGATDSGDADLYFGEGSTNNIQYGVHWDWNSGYRFTWYTRNAGTDTTLFYYDTNNTSYVYWSRAFHMNNNDINYANQLHFNNGLRFVDEGNSNYLRFRADDTNGPVGIKFYDGNDTLYGHVYGDGDGANFGLLNRDEQWAVRTTATQTSLYYDGSEKLLTTSTGISVNGNVQATQTIGNLTSGSLGQQMEKGSTAVTTLRFDADRWRLYAGAGAGEVVTVQQFGNVGIGDISPDAKLTVYRTDTTYAINLSNTEARAGLSVKSSSTFDSKLTISSGASSRQYIQAVNNAATTGRDIVLNPYGGNIGIGTTSPSQKLDVVGSIEVSDGIYIGGTAAANKLDDYEEGTYTPSITATGTDASGFSSIGYYTKIGDIVHVEMRISKFVDEDGSCRITNITLPFAANNTSTIYYKGGLWHSETYDKSNLFSLLRESTINLTPYNGATNSLSLASDESNTIGVNITYKAQ